MICMKNLRFSSRLRARTPLPRTPLPSIKLIETETKIEESILEGYTCIFIMSLK